MDEQRIFLTAEQAKSVLLKGKSIHTFRSIGAVLIGADWQRKNIIDLIDNAEAETIEIGGPGCKKSGHGLVVWSGGPLFIECDMAKLEALEKSLTL